MQTSKLYTIHRIRDYIAIAFSGTIIAYGASYLDPDVTERLLKNLIEQHSASTKPETL